MDSLFLKLLLSLTLIIASFLLTRILRELAIRFGKKHDYDPSRIFQVSVIINTSAVIIAVLLLSIIWGFTGKGFVVFASSIFAIIGIALFASWSILSNVTAGLILFFGAPYRVYDRIRVLDGDNTVTGRLTHMGLIYLGIEDEDGNFYTLPNNVILQKTVIRLAEGKELPIDKKHCR